VPYLSSQGADLFYYEQGSGPAMLMIHGWACDGADWSWLAAEMSADHRCVLLDNRGHGRSAPNPGGYNPVLFAADAARVIESLGLAPAVVVGHSLGGVIASALAIERPELLRALVLVDPGYGALDESLAGPMAAVRKDPHALAGAIFDRFYTPNTPSWLPTWHRRRTLSTPPDVLRESLLGTYEGEGGMGRRVVGQTWFRRRNVPILAVYAGTGASVAEWDRGLEHGPRDEIVVWPEHGHFLHQEAPERFAGEVRRWLTDLDTAQ
jgi:pimeloyl-ACP methyl ester carboxylesterase